MDFDLKQAAARFEKEQRKRQEEVRKRAEREKRTKEAAEKRQREIEELQRIRRLREAEIAEQARLAEEAEVRAGGGIRFHARLFPQLTTVPGDKITLPVSALTQLESQNALDRGPMIFQISLDERSLSKVGDTEVLGLGKETLGVKRVCSYGGVLEFSAEEGFVGLPKHVWENLGLNRQGEEGTDGVQKVHIRYVRLPKGTYAKLEPNALDFAELSNHKAILETKLRNHTTLSVGEELSVEYGGLEYRLKVLELKPEDAVSVIETDLEVDVTPPLKTTDNGWRVLIPLVFGKVQEGIVEEGKYQYYKFTVEESLAKAVVSGEMDIVVTLLMNGWERGESSSRQISNGEREESDADLYLASQPILYPTQHQHQWSSHDFQTKVIVISGLDAGKFKGAGQYSLGVYGFKGTSKFTVNIEAKVRNTGGQSSRGQLLSGKTEAKSSLENSFDLGQCGNCKQFVSQRTLMLHEAYCRRHNVVCDFPSCGAILRKEEKANHVHCQKCGEAMRGVELQKHQSVIHAPLTCECGAVMEMDEMVKHRSETCPFRTILCQYCGGLVQARGTAVNRRDHLQGLTQHESECGSRTTPCDICKKPIMLKEMKLHIAAVHGEGFKESNSNMLQASTFGEDVVMAELGKIEDVNFLKHTDVDPYFRPMSNVDRMSDVDIYPPRSVHSKIVNTVSCPICGLGLHSERDVSHHIEVSHE